MIERDGLLYGSQANFVVWFRVLTNQETSSLEVDGSRDENDSMDVWIHEIG